MVSKRTGLGTLAVVSMTGLAVVATDVLNDWVGDWGTPLWISAGFFFPFVAGLAWGTGGRGTRGLIVGALIGALVVLAPGIGYALIEETDLSAQRLPLLWALFTPLAMAQGVIALPVGTNARSAIPS